MHEQNWHLEAPRRIVETELQAVGYPLCRYLSVDTGSLVPRQYSVARTRGEALIIDTIPPLVE